MNDFLFALNVVLPIILLIALGYFLKRINLIPKEAFNFVNKLVFMVLLPVNLFMSVYDASGFDAFDFKFVLFISIAFIALFLLGLVFVIVFIKDKRQKGVILQAFVRPNYAIIGIPLATAIGGSEAGALASLVALVSIPITNIFATIALSVFVEDEKEEGSEKRHLFKTTLLKIVKNPLIIGVVLGLIALLVRMILVNNGIEFRLKDIGFLYSSLSLISRASTPIALITLGGLFNFMSLKDNVKNLIIVLASRILIPLSIFIIALLAFDFNANEYATMIGLFVSPVAVSSAIMAKEMNNDGELANEIVVVTTVLSMVTIFVSILVFRIIGVF